MRKSSHWLLTLVVGLVTIPAIAQDPQGTRSHVVKQGDTLWSLSRTYLQDPYRWQEIQQLNASVISDPNRIVPGTVLRIPGGASASASAGVGQAETGAVATVGGVAAQPQPPIAIPRDTAGEPRPVDTRRFRMAAPSVREWEHYAAPWVDVAEGPPAAGRFIRSTELPGIAQASARTRFQLNELVYFEAPANATPAVGQRYLTFSRGAILRDKGQVMIPTGVIVVERVGAAGEASVGRVLRQFAMVTLSDGIIPLETPAVAAGAQAATVSGGPLTNVVWVLGDPVLPSIQSYLILDAASADGFSIGDEVTLVRPREQTSDGVWLPEQEIARAHVVRVNDRASTAIVVHQTQPAITIGAAARLTARMP